MSELVLTKREKKMIKEYRLANNNPAPSNKKLLLERKEKKKKKEGERDRKREHNETHYHAHFFGQKRILPKKIKRHHLELLLSQLGLYLPEKTSGLSLEMRKQLASPEQKDIIVKMIRQFINEEFGTEEPEMEVYGTVLAITPASSATTFSQFVVAPTFASCQNVTQLAVIFDEFKYVKGHIRTVPVAAPGKHNPKRTMHAPGYIDYADNTTPSTYNSVLCADTSKLFAVESLSPEKDQQHWELRPQQQPDTSWRNTNDSTQVIWWKWYFPAGSLTGATLVDADYCFFVQWKWTVKFRQVTAI